MATPRLACAANPCTNSISIGVNKERKIGHGCLCKFHSLPLCPDGYLFSLTGWDSLQDHLNYIADKERQASVAEDFGSAMRLDVGGLIMEHVVLSVETTLRILEAPLTEVARITFSDRASLEKAKPVVEKYVAYANREETLPIAAAFGQTVDLENIEEIKIIFIVGWKTAEVNSSLSQINVRAYCLQWLRCWNCRTRRHSGTPTT